MRLLIALVPLSLFTISGCIIARDGPPADPFGNLAFDWSFAGETDCGAANVDNVEVILSQGGEVVFDKDEACFGGGLTITELDSGPYDVDLKAFSGAGDILFEATVGHAVVPEDEGTVDLGTVEFTSTGDRPPPVQEGTLSFFWDFLYPRDAAVQDCALAGVETVDVTITPQDVEGEPFQQTSACDDQHQGLDISSLNAGRYTLHLTANGSYNGQSIALYDSGDIVVDIAGEETTDLGNIDMARNNSEFSDFNVSWIFGDDNTCAGNDSSNVTLSFQRDGEDTPEDTLTVDCNAASVLRQTFVPGTYTVTAVTDGTVAYGVSVDVDLAPNSAADVSLSLVPPNG